MFAPPGGQVCEDDPPVLELHGQARPQRWLRRRPRRRALHELQAHESGVVENTATRHAGHGR